MMVNNLERVGRFGWIEIYDNNIMRIVNGVQFDVGIGIGIGITIKIFGHKIIHLTEYVKKTSASV